MSESLSDYLYAAKGQMYGYLYQIDRVLYWLSVSPENSIVSIETDDDVVIRLQQGENIETIYEQDKASIKKKYPFSNTNKNLWKSITNWLTLIKTKNIDVANSKFLLATNVSCKGNSIIKSLSSASVDKNIYNTAYQELTNIANNNKSKTLLPYIDKFKEYSKEDIVGLLKRIELCECHKNYDRQNFIEQIIQNLHLKDDELPYYDIMNSLYGWIVNTCLSLWEKDLDSLFTPKMLWKKRDFLKQQIALKPFIEQATDLIPVTSYEQEKEKGSTFVKQLDIIEVGEDEKLKAIQDFLRAKQEKHKYALNANITQSHIIAYEESLKENWQQVFWKHKRLNKNTPADIGYEVYCETLKYKGKLAGVEPTYSYLSNGSYHKLANSLLIGWHPNWQNIINKYGTNIGNR